MNFRKNIFVFFIVLSLLFCIASASASDVNETITAADDEQQVLEEINEETLAIEEDNESTLNANENGDVILNKQTNSEEQILEKSNTNEYVLSAAETGNLKVDIFKQTGSYFHDKILYLKITDANTGNPVNLKNLNANLKINGKTADDNNDFVFDVDLNYKGNGIYTILLNEVAFDGNPGSYNINVWWIEQIGSYATVLKNFKVSSNTVNVKISKCKVTIKAKKLTTKRKSGKVFKIKVTDKNKKPIKNEQIILKIKNGSKYKYVYLHTNAKGIAKYKKASKLGVGKHKVKIYLEDNHHYSGTAKSYIIIKKTSTAKKTKKTTKKTKTKTKTKNTKKTKTKTKTSNTNKNSNTVKQKLNTKMTIDSCNAVSSSQYHFKVTLKDSNGKSLANKKIKIETGMYVGSLSYSQDDYVTTNSNGVAEGYVTPMMGGITTWEATFKFEGDDSYNPSSAYKYIG